MTPSVSVLMAVNEGRFLAPALDTLRAQHFRDFELVLVDDCADADTKALIERFRAEEPRLRVLTNETPLGLPASLNRGLAACRGALVARADGDDLYAPERLGRQVAEMTRRPKLGALSCGHHRIDEHGRRLWTRRPVTGPEALRFRALFVNPLLHPGVMFRAEAVRAVGGYDERFWTAQDSDLWARLGAVAELDNLPEPLVSWRKHGASMLSRRGDAGKALSHGVSARLQGAYLGAPIDPETAGTTAETWRSFHALPPEAVRRGERGLARIMAQAQMQESPDILTDFRQTTARALARQARWAARRGALRDAAAFARRAATWRLGDPAAEAA